MSWIGNQCTVTLWTWDLDGDGDVDSLLPNPTFSYDALGTYNVTLTLATTCGGTLNDTKALRIVNRPPTAGTLEASHATATRLDTVNFTAVGADDEDGSVVGYIFTVDGVDRPEQTSNVLNVTFSTLGNHTVTVRATDNEGGISAPSNVVTVNVENILPTAVLSASREKATRLDTVTFSGLGSSDPDGNVTGYLFTIDGDTKPEQAAGNYSVTFDALGNHSVSLIVRDNDGDLSAPSGPVVVEIVNIPPAAVIGASHEQATRLDTVTFSGLGSSDSDGNVTGYLFTIDGDAKPEQASNSYSVTFDALGNHSASLIVRDNDGDLSAPSGPVVVEIVNIPPTASISGPETANVGQSVSFDGSGSSDPDGTVERYEFFVDGVSQGIQTGSTLARSFSTPGPHAVKLRVYDNDGGVSEFAETSILITEGLTVKISGVKAKYDPVEALASGIGGTVQVANTDGDPVSAFVIVQVTHLNPVDGSPLRSEVAASGNTDASGSFAFQVSLTYRLAGTYRIDVAAIASFNSGFAHEDYEIGL